MTTLTEPGQIYPYINNEKEKISLKTKLIVAAGGVGLLAATIVGGAWALSGDEKPRNPGVSAPVDRVNPEVVSDLIGVRGEESTVEMTGIATGETLALLEAHSKNYDDWRGMELNFLKDMNLITDEQQDFLESNYATLSQKSDKSTFTDAEVLAAVALDTADASAQGDVNVGAAMLPLVISPKQKSYNDTLRSVADSNIGAVINIFRPGADELPQLQPGTNFIQETIGDVKQARPIIQTMTKNVDGSNEIFTELGIYVLNSDGNGNEQWQSVERYDLDSETVQSALDSLQN